MLERIFEENFNSKSSVEKEKIKFITEVFRDNKDTFKKMIRRHGLGEAYRFLKQTMEHLPKNIFLIEEKNPKVKDMKNNIYIQLGYYEIPCPQKYNPESYFNGNLSITKKGVKVFEKYWELSNQTKNNL